ncbi:DUF3093 domain-containing protein [Amycolatopsis saalfeldensis]|uniref:DUF3093 domain-containing protein n=1 Tax=Amycolatopsis saalfeldensis TaxID=394193 RepID=A0A1H8X7R5_9PSEU|nr:DUF3093 domain-containing protein [Amycolatopsis saalfeldensis]SEP35974.1 Protein of unknown function [Amycolatopsis saalfeldensis]
MGDTVNTAVTSGIRHSERLYVPWWGWPLPMLGAILLGVEIHLGYPSIPMWIPLAVAVPVMAALLLSLGRSRVRVTGGDEPELWVGDAHLPLRFAGTVEVLGTAAKRPAMGRDGDPAAFVLHRGWVGPAVRVELTDPDDPTPYWLFSTRRPERVAELLRARS